MIVLQSEIPGLTPYVRGKVRDMYDLGDTVLIVVSDRISAFDVVMPNGIPGKGAVLTQFSKFWFEKTEHVIRNHYITCDVATMTPQIEKAGGHVDAQTAAMLEGRSMLVFKAKPFPVECIVRGYLAGSLYKEYLAAGGETQKVTIHGVELPAGMKNSEILAQPFFTPSTKADEGHDINISLEQAEEIIGDRARELAYSALRIYGTARELAAERGIIIADTKFEFGLDAEGELMLIDEALTPDSSRFWDASTYKPGQNQPSYDKQYLRDWLEACGWNKTPPAPTLPDNVVAETSAKYHEAYRRITGNELK